MSKTDTVYLPPPDVLAHLHGCPARSERIETFESESPRKAFDPDGKEIFRYAIVRTERCIDCGAQLVTKLGDKSDTTMFASQR